MTSRCEEWEAHKAVRVGGKSPGIWWLTLPACPPTQPEACVSKLVIVPGIVTAASRPKHKATYLTIQCSKCK